MKLVEYKELLLNQDLNKLETELKRYHIIKEFLSSNDISHNAEEGKTVKNTLTIEGLGEFSYFVYISPKEYNNGTLRKRFMLDESNSKGYRANDLREILFHHFLPLLKSYDDYLITWGSLSWGKDKYVEKIVKKWDKYFIELEKTLDKVCGSPLEEVFLKNYSDNFKQGSATVFGGPKGKAIIWTTVSGGYNIQQKHLRMFCKPLTETHIKEFGVVFK